MQELPESVERMVESMYEELTGGQAAASADLLPIATNVEGGLAPMCLKEMVGTGRLELPTSTVSKLIYSIPSTTYITARDRPNP
jgi:hypothetical protein